MQFLAGALGFLDPPLLGPYSAALLVLLILPIPLTWVLSLSVLTCSQASRLYGFSYDPKPPLGRHSPPHWSKLLGRVSGFFFPLRSSLAYFSASPPCFRKWHLQPRSCFCWNPKVISRTSSSPSIPDNPSIIFCSLLKIWMLFFFFSHHHDTGVTLTSPMYKDTMACKAPSFWLVSTYLPQNSPGEL